MQNLVELFGRYLNTYNTTILQQITKLAKKISK